MPKISCIIPTYNEGPRIGKVLKVVYRHPLLHEIIVVDDNSCDNTKQIIRTFPAIQLIEHTVNQGKSKSVADGIKVATGNYILLLDADLLGLNKKNINDLIEPIEKAQAEVTISFRKNAWPLWPFRNLDYLSGERIFPKARVAHLIEDISLLPNYGLEVFLNKVIIQDQLHLAVVLWPNVENVFHHRKHGWWQGTKNIVKIWRDVLCTISIIEMYTQNIKMRRLMIR